MTNRDIFDSIFEQMLAEAIKEFKSTEQSKLLQEKLDRMNRDCVTMFTEDERSFAADCFALIFESASQEEIYIYRKGLRDCVWLLKILGIL